MVKDLIACFRGLHAVASRGNTLQQPMATACEGHVLHCRAPRLNFRKTFSRVASRCTRPHGHSALAASASTPLTGYIDHGGSNGAAREAVAPLDHEILDLRFPNA